MAKIGIRLADGKFYPILEEGAAIKKRLVVTTVKDDQPSVQIDVYRSTEASDSYVGSLIIENIPPRPSGAPDIRLDLELDEDGNLSAFAEEEATGEHQALAVSLKSLAEEEKYEIPDFDFQEDEEFDLSTDDLPEANPFSADTTSFDGEFDDGPDDAPSFEEPDGESAALAAGSTEGEERKKASPVLVGILAALGTAAILVAAFLIYRYTADRQPEPPVAPIAAPVAAPAPTPEPAAPAAAPAAPAPAPAPEPAAAAPAPAPAKPAEPAKKAGTWHKIKWGDTLWDISIAYYRTPWLYRTVAKANKIKNPDLIISGTWIFIPPR